MKFIKKHGYALFTTGILIATLGLLVYANSHIRGVIEAAREDSYMRASARHCAWLLSEEFIGPESLGQCYKASHIIMTTPLPQE